MPSPQYTRSLFGAAGLANLAVAGSFLFFRAALTPLLALDPITGTNAAMWNLAAGCVAVFGYTYLRVAQDPVRFRPYVHVGAIGKLIAVAAAAVPWLAGDGGGRLAALIAGDLVFAALFLHWLRRTR